MPDYNFFKHPVYDSLEHKYNTYLVKHRANQNKGGDSRSYRDSERKKTYASEHSFMAECNIPEFESIEEANKFAKRVYKTQKWSKLWQDSVENDVGQIFNATPSIVGMNSRNKSLSGFTDGRTITLCQITGMNKYILLHEMAHCLGNMHHGRSFRQCVLELVGAFMGTKEKKVLKREFKRRKLACGEPRQPLTFDKWVASKDRMEKMREQRDFFEAGRALLKR
jgi:hypothetical protein